MPQRQSPRGSSLQLRTSSSDSDPLHHRPITDRSPKVGDRRSPRGAQSDSVNQKKLGTRIADLESQLGQAQDELKNLKLQLATAEAAKKEAQEELEKKAIVPSITHPDEVPDENQQETDVFEVPVENVTVEAMAELSQLSDQDDEKSEPTDLYSTEPPAIPEPEKLSFEELAMTNDEINLLKAKLEEKVKELEGSCQEMEGLKKQLNEAGSEIALVRAEEEEMALRLSQMGEDLKSSKANEAHLEERLEAAERVKEALEAEMKRLSVQTAQWRKAADAAAAVLAGGVEMNNGRRISERCGSMDKHFGGVFESSAGGYGGYVGSPVLGDDFDDGYGSGKRKGSGIRMFGELWKRKSQK